MNPKKSAFLIVLLILVVGLVFISQDVLYVSHEALVADEFAALLSQTEQRLPREEVDLAEYPPFGGRNSAPFARVASWQIESAQLDQVGRLLPSILDDDPIYGIEAELRVTFADGEEALLMWDSWSYGNVLGPLLIDGGSGPPGSIRRAAVTRVPEEAPLSILPVEPEQPQPVPTALAPAWSGRLTTGSSQPLHGAPPYTASLSASFNTSAAGLPAACERLVWNFGDGTEAAQPCALNKDSPSTSWYASHSYEQPGIYHARAHLELAGGTVIESERSQTIMVATPQPPSLRAIALRWAAWVTLLTGTGLALIWLLFQRGRRRLLGTALLGLFLITFVPPFSYVPDPLGIVLTVTGGYRYDPRLPLANRFLIAGDPTEPLRPTLDALIGQTGLDPLDPASPLARYDFVKVVQQPYHTAVHVRFTYADGRKRTYPVPLRQPRDRIAFYDCCWRYDGLGRLRAEHRPLPPVPFAEAGAGALGLPEPLPLPAIDSENPQMWFGGGSNPLNRRLLWSPRGNAFLAPRQNGNATDLWLLSAEGADARRVAANVWEYAWLSDGAGVVYSRVEQAEQEGIGGPARHIYLVTAGGSEPQALLTLPTWPSAFPAVTKAGLWYVQDETLWLLPLGTETGLEPQPLGPLPDAGSNARSPRPVQVSPAPDGERVAYTCGAALCLVAPDGSDRVVAVSDRRGVALSWRPDGQQLAAVFWDYQGGDGQPATLMLLERDGAVVAELPVAPEGPVDPPQWTPDGNHLFLQTFPRDGRRIVVVDTSRGEVVDLSQPRWDAFFALRPDGERLLLSNGRGGFWLVPLRLAAAISPDPLPGTESRVHTRPSYVLACGRWQLQSQICP